MKSNIKNKKPLTQRQYEVLQYLVTFVLAHHYQPDLTVMADVFGITSQAIKHRLYWIEQKNWIKRRPSQQRAIELSPEAVKLVRGKLSKDDWIKV